MNDIISNKILVILGSHQDSPQKLAHCIDLITYLKSEGLDVCFSTHSSYGLDKISEISDYVVFDSDNSFIDEFDLLNNLDKFEIDSISQRWLNWFSPTGSEYLKSYLSPAPHSKSALKILRNGVKVAGSSGYPWSVYLEYDFSIPLVSMRNLLIEKIDEILRSRKNSLALMRKGESFLNGGFFLFQTNVLSKNRLLSHDWDQDKEKWFSCFSNMFFEEIAETLLLQDGFSILYKDAQTFIESVWGDQSKTNLYSLTTSLDVSKRSSRVLVSESLKNSFFPHKVDDGFEILSYCYNNSNSTSFEITNTRIRVGQTEENIGTFTMKPRSWFNTFKMNLDPQISGDEVVSLEFNVKSSDDDYVHYFSQNFKVRDLEKFWKIRRFEMA